MTGLYRIRIFALFLFGLFVLGVDGCTGSPETTMSGYLIKVGSHMVFSEDFTEELDLKLAAYPYDFKKNRVEYNQIVFDLVSILSEESVLLAAAFDTGIRVTTSELSCAIVSCREDYPEDSFDQMLLENAISYSYWKKTLKKDLIIDKFIQQELKDKIEISPEDVVLFYNEHIGQKVVADENKFVSHLRVEKSQESYAEWIMALKKLYPVDINKKALTPFLMGLEKNKGHVND
ncbi:MAG: hypothetical protein GY710_19845 [Desulfobacteraceae bacterium]|nr:hypothetical protein [Desulfobacteraceae bacterium]